MEFTQICAKLKSDDETEANTQKKAVQSLVDGIKKHGKKDEMSKEKGAELSAPKLTAPKKHARKKSMNPDDMFGGGMSPPSDGGDIDFEDGEDEE